ncbi:MAG: OadG family protein [Gammaproteobacteria bacterium]|jgi:oxaloacetate decarboxylase gamma subunit|nr:OadG family protein [Gammaproteobacteria bacterium]
MNEGVELVLVGMGTVFAFLTILVVMTTLMSNLVMRLERDEVSPAEEQGSIDTVLVAAITAAIGKHRSGNH